MWSTTGFQHFVVLETTTATCLTNQNETQELIYCYKQGETI